MRSVRLVIDRAIVGGTELLLEQGHLHVVVRDREAGPGPSDWELLVVTEEVAEVRPGAHAVVITTADGHRLRGRALVRFSDGHRHLLRGDDDLRGIEGALD